MLETLRDRVGTPELVPKNVICKAYTYPIASSLIIIRTDAVQPKNQKVDRYCEP